jgi:hypothetical protein
METGAHDRTRGHATITSAGSAFASQCAGLNLTSIWFAGFLALMLFGQAEVRAETVGEKSPGGPLSGQFIIRQGDPLQASRQAINLASSPVSARSLSGQFIIHDERSTRSYVSPLSLATNRGLVRIEPTFLTVSCERIKQVLLREIGGNESWHGKIFLALHSAIDADESIRITSEHFRDGWHYRVDLADQLERAHFVRAMVQVLLLEVANRNAGEHSAEIPAWLIAGLTQQLLASSELELVIPPPVSIGSGLSVAATDFDHRRENPLEQAHKELLQGRLLTFEELSWPTDQQMAGAVYQGSAQLFVDELLRLKDGRACLREMLAQLPTFYNWQFAFLRAFQPWFQRSLDVEKWWALAAVRFTGRELAQTWPLEESWHKLDALVHEGIQIRSATNDLPLHTEVTFQTIIREWDRPRQVQVLQAKIRELQMLRMRVAQELVPVVDRYQQTLESYLQHNGKVLVLPFLKRAAVNHAADIAIKNLDELDSQRSELRPQKPAAATAQASSRP